MIITKTGPELESHSLRDFAWKGLRRYSNTYAVTEKIVSRFGLPKKQHANARKQAEQIGFCLSQAREYFHAAQDASLATKPVQLYYGCMSLALAEILWKGDGTNSLDKLRGSDGRHGLEVKFDPNLSITTPNACALLKAQEDTKGTFKIWKKFARNVPIAGVAQTTRTSGSGERGNQILYLPDDKPLPDNAEGYTLQDCIRNLPTLFHEIAQHGQRSSLVRATFERTTQDRNDSLPPVITDSAIIHPGDAAAIDQIKSEFLVSPRMTERIFYHEMGSGFMIRFALDGAGYEPPLRAPESTSISPKLTFLKPNNSVLNEFGYFYVALYIGGMFSRYYPDLWMKHLQSNSELSLILEMVCTEAAERLPLLTLCCLDQTLYLSKD